MPTSRQDVIDMLAACERRELVLVLEASDVSFGDAQSSRELAERIANALWWHWTTPLGYALDRVDLDHIVRGVARRLKVGDLPSHTDDWGRLSHLTRTLLDDVAPVRFQDLRADHRARARGNPFPTLAFGTGSLGSYGLGAGGRAVLRFATGPVGRWVPYIPHIGPWFLAIRKASATAAVVGTPLSLALGVLAVNQALGRRWRRVLPLLLSIGALNAHQRVHTAVEV
ncbi:MAG: hypothetical protein EA397_09600 [Deltaproteobacteria bacterium]|nr:MAG: hypothetical protein EA397_09600 [Deltaproteobacteria bacterium]